MAATLVGAVVTYMVFGIGWSPGERAPEGIPVVTTYAQLLEEPAHALSDGVRVRFGLEHDDIGADGPTAYLYMLLEADEPFVETGPFGTWPQTLPPGPGSLVVRTRIGGRRAADRLVPPSSGTACAGFPVGLCPARASGGRRARGMSCPPRTSRSTRSRPTRGSS